MGEGRGEGLWAGGPPGYKEIGRRTGWKEKVWGRRYQAIVISDEEEMQVSRMRYVLSG